MRRAVRPRDSAQAARSPRSAAARATGASCTTYSHASTDQQTTEPEADPDPAAAATTAPSEAAAPSAANKATTAATSEAAAPAATPAAAATTTTTAAAGQLHAAAEIFTIEEMERGQTDVGHFLFAENEALIGRGIVGLRNAGSGHRGCGCATHQRKTQSGGTQHLHGGGFGCAFLLRSLLDPSHGRILRHFL
jgi:hypothetical protein